ncbi:MAG TPA: aminotransferase class I/II-fold pyridoxal phosphate-dependent enzyme, partial [Stellaceae bacterium]|nr:aminotransferase class I/II-fold pyridoxal phosphate-dependent enzyme [Stellaceae bacterium]
MSVRRAIHDLETSRIADIVALGFGDPDVIALWYGEGDVPTPGFIGEVAAAAMRAGETFYTYKAGLPELRHALADYLSGLYTRPVAMERIVVTSAGIGALMLMAQALIDPGDNLVIVAPIWPNIAAVVSIMGGEPRLVSLDPVPGGGWRLDIDKLIPACDGRTKGIFVNSPANPTGWTASADEIAALTDFARRRGVWIVADEVYHRIVYGDRVAPSFLAPGEPEDRLIVVNSFSKSWAMTGWRLGWMVVPAELTDTYVKLIQFNVSGAPTFIQHAAVVAIRDGDSYIAEMVERCRIGRDLVVERLGGLPRVR